MGNTTVVAVTTDSGSLAEDHHTLRVVEAPTNLTGLMQLAWVADAGKPVGDAHCTQNIRSSPTAPASIRPTLMICWRTSATKSVYTVAVDTDKAPSGPDSVAALDKAWDAAG